MEQNKTALVTGASRGIGRAIALQLAEDGFDIAVIFAGNEAAAQETCALIEQKGRKAVPVRCDVSDPQQCRDAVKAVLDNFGGIDVLVNNAGITRDALVLSMKEEDFEKVIDTNLNSAFYMIKNTYHQFMKRRSGRIINISSVSGVAGNAGQANYSAAKAGILGLTKSAAKELASRNITVNAIAPGFIETDMTAVLSERVREATLAQIPLARFGQAEDVAAAAAFLASEESRYMTGQTLHVDGGMFM